MTEPHATRIVLIGHGPVGSRFVDELLPAVRDGRVALTVLGAERESAYNRVLLAEYAVGRADRARLDLSDPAVVTEAGVSLRLGEAAVAIDRNRQSVSLSSGETVPYDRLVFATGARANIPTLAGLEPSRVGSGGFVDAESARLPRGIVVLRDLLDADTTREAVAQKSRLVILGAGVLGMELALAAREQGADVAVVYHGEVPMERNLDRGGGLVLARAAERAGVTMFDHARAESVLLRTRDDGYQIFDALVCADGTQVDGDLLVLSCGVGARTELAARAGLAVSRGILVDEELRSWSDPDVFAIGDCAHVATRTDTAHEHVAGGPTGLIGPGWRQADWLAAALSAESAGRHRPELMAGERRSVVMLKSEGVNVVAAGDIRVDPWDGPGADGEQREVAQWADPARGRYLKTVARAGVLEGFVCAGLPRVAAELTLLFERGSDIPSDPSMLLQLDSVGAPAAGSTTLAADDTLCWCNGVTAGAVSECVSHGASSVEAVGAATRAGTGCGGCKGRIAQLLAAAVPPSQSVEV